MAPEGNDHLTLWDVGPQQLRVDFKGGRIVSDAGYPDHNDHDDLRHDPLFHILADVSPDADQPVASGSTLARFAYAFTRRQAELPPEEHPVLLEVQGAKPRRLKVLNRCLVELFVRTRTQPPAEVILDVDATDDPTHGAQALIGQPRTSLTPRASRASACTAWRGPGTTCRPSCSPPDQTPARQQSTWASWAQRGVNQLPLQELACVSFEAPGDFLRLFESREGIDGKASLAPTPCRRRELRPV